MPWSILRDLAMADSVFGFDKPEDSPGLLLWQTTITWQRLIKKALHPYAISHAQFVILAIMLWFEGIDQESTQILIVRQSKLDKMTVSKSLKQLAAEGFVKRAEHTHDTRVKSVRLTARGRTMASKLVPIVEKIDAHFFAIAGQANQQSLVTSLSKIIAKI